MMSSSSQSIWPLSPTRTISLLVALVALGLGLRLHALSPYLVYPDSYQSLLVAGNLLHTHHAVAPLGPGGLSYPDFFAWTRPLYPAFIATLAATGLDLATAARVVSLVASLAAIPLAYLLLQGLMRSRAAGLIAAGLIAISYDHVTWTGFILTEPLGVALALLATWQLWRHRPQPVALADPQDILTGTLLAIATLARYEYAVLLIPALLFAAPQFSRLRAANLAAAYVITLAVGLALAQPFAFGTTAVWIAIRGFLPLAAITLAVVLLGYAATRRHARRLAESRLVITTLLFLPAAFFLGALIAIPAARTFAANDFLITLAALAGYTLMFARPAQRPLATYSLLAATLLAATYYQVNPTMDRYYTHLIPFLLIPATYFLATLMPATTRAGERAVLPRGVLLSKFVLVPAATLIVALQLLASLIGLRADQSTNWFAPSSEATTAKWLSPSLKPTTLLIASLPEPYFYYTHHPTQSIADTYPYLYPGDASPTAPIAIVRDTAMDYLYPHFAAALDRTALTPSAEHPAGPLLYRTDTIPATDPTRVYLTDLATLKAQLAATR